MPAESIVIIGGAVLFFGLIFAWRHAILLVGLIGQLVWMGAIMASVGWVIGLFLCVLVYPLGFWPALLALNIFDRTRY